MSSDQLSLDRLSLSDPFDLADQLEMTLENSDCFLMELEEGGADRTHEELLAAMIANNHLYKRMIKKIDEEDSSDPPGPSDPNLYMCNALQDNSHRRCDARAVDGRFCQPHADKLYSGALILQASQINYCDCSEGCDEYVCVSNS